MTVLASAALLPHMPFDNDYLWDRARPSEYFHPHSDAKSVALPSIRQAIPELHMIAPCRDGDSRAASNGPCASVATSEYISSPTSHKRRRISNEEEQESLRARQVPRVYRNPKHRVPHSPRLRSSSSTSTRWSPSAPAASSRPSIGIPAPVEVKEPVIPRVTLPSLKATMTLERDTHGTRESSLDRSQGSPTTRRPSVMSIVEHSHPYPSPSYDFPYHHQSRYQSQPPSPIRVYDRAPFSAGPYPPPHYHEAGRFGDMGANGMVGDTKQRKRRGNLPKEMTDKLRAWCVAHLQHPYPTEDEKQELMRQTGLQMNQISNWFINARRRQLPAMINNARAESDLSGGREASDARDSKLHASPSSVGYDGLSKRDNVPLSDGEGTSSDEAMDLLRRRGVGNMKRGSV